MKTKPGISFDEAFRLVMSAARTLGTESVSIHDSLSRVLAEDVVSDLDMPPFDKSAVDGYACRRQDLGGDLRVVEVIPAGFIPEKIVREGECSKIMTGAMVPEGADCVVMVEFAEELSEGVVRLAGHNTESNICPRGEDAKTGDVVIKSGAVIGPQQIGILASVGCRRPVVAVRPRVGVVATGDEIQEIDERLELGMIRNSNGHQLCAQTKLAGAVPTYYGIYRDVERDISIALKKALYDSNVVIISGGVSMGDYDLVPEVLRNSGAEILFDRIAVKPGRPTLFGLVSGAFCFGLPGNPVSTFVIFEILVKPFLRAMMGVVNAQRNIFAQAAETITRKKSDCDAWLPAKTTDDGRVKPIDYHGSAHIQALSAADGLIMIPSGAGEVREGDPVAFRTIS